MADIAPDTFIILSSDEKYFPLAKGLILSLLENGIVGNDVAIGFFDIGCTPISLRWLEERQVVIRSPENRIMGELADESFGYTRAQTCRGFLPELFPGARIYVWIDSDAWLQIPEGVHLLRRAASSNSGRIALCPECHYSYVSLNDNLVPRLTRQYLRYEPLYGAHIAGVMSQRTMLNSGVFALTADSTIWSDWKAEINNLYTRKELRQKSSVLHFAEQLSLNVLLATTDRTVLLDPIYNYVCLWNFPKVDENGLVRISFAPFQTIGIVHLAGGWRQFGDEYLSRRLLYRGGDYLTPTDRAALAALSASPQPRASFR